MSFSSRRRNYLLTPHRRDGLIEWMKSMLMHSFVLDALDATGGDTFSHFETLIDQHIELQDDKGTRLSPLQTLVPTVSTFHTRLPLRRAFEAYNKKHALTKRRHVTISFNELRHILNLAQIMALRGGFEDDDDDNDDDVPVDTGRHKILDSTRDVSLTESPSASTQKMAPPSTEAVSVVGTLVAHSSNRGAVETATNPCTASSSTNAANANNSQPTSFSLSPEACSFRGPRLITFDGDQTLYQDGANFSKNTKLATYICRLLQEGVTLAVVTAAGYEYQSHKYEYRLSGLLEFFQEKALPEEDCRRFYMFGGECNYLLGLGADYRLHPVAERGPGGWKTSTQHLEDGPANWKEEAVKELLTVAENSLSSSKEDLKLQARLIRKRRAVGLVPQSPETLIPREALDEAVLRVQSELGQYPQSLPFCAFNGGRDVWVDVGNKRVGVQILQSYLGVQAPECLHIGDQFLNTGNDYAARSVCPCIWITSPEETTYILKSILRLAQVSLLQTAEADSTNEEDEEEEKETTAASIMEMTPNKASAVDFADFERRVNSVQQMDVYTGEVVSDRKHAKY